MKTLQGLIVINTGNGKGKTTSAFGVALRAWGYGMKVAILQFIKKARCGEHLAAKKIGLEVTAGGGGFFRPGQDTEKHRQLAVKLWETAKAKIASGEYDVIVLDELSYPLRFGWLNVADVVATLKARPPALHVLITGREVPPELIELADTVTDMTEVKHAWRKGIKAQKGIEF